MNNNKLIENKLLSKNNEESYLLSVIEDILIDNEYINIMNNINSMKFITNGKWDWEHGINHAKRVAKYTKKILEDLGYDNITVALGTIAGLLHDIGLEKGIKPGHAKESGIRSSEYLAKFNINEEYIKLITEAIADHSKGNNIKSVIGASLLLADKLDITYQRVENSSIKDEINNEFLKMRDVLIDINREKMVIEYVTVDNFNQKVLNNWDKAILIPLKVAEYLNRECIFKINGEKQNLLNVLN